MRQKIFGNSDTRTSIGIALAIIGGILILFFPVVLFGINQVVREGETDLTKKEVSRSENLLVNEINRLDRSLLDWSAWDDTYQFAQDLNDEYIEGNLADSSIINLGIDIILMVDRSQNIVYGKHVDRAMEMEAPIPFDGQSLLEAYPILLNFSDLQSGHKGIAWISGHAMLIASRPILTSAKEGPPSGTLIWIRLLNSIEMEKLSSLAERQVSIFPAGSVMDGEVGLPAADTLQGEVFVYPKTTETISGYKYLQDLNGAPVLVLQVDNPRDLYRQGRSSISIFSGIVLFVSAILFVVFFLISRAMLESRKISRAYFQRFHTIITQSSEAFLLISKDLKVLELNPIAEALIGQPADQSPPARLNELLQFDPNIDEDFINQVCQSGKAAVLHCVRHDGTSMDVELSASNVTTPDLQAFSLILRDVTGRKLEETALKASEERYMLAVNGANDGIWDWNLMTGEVYYSMRWKTMLGNTDHEIGTQPDEWLDRIHPDDLLSLQHQLADHLHNRTTNFESEYRIQLKDGRYRWMLARGVAIWDEAGYAKRIAGSQTDIHDRKELEERLRFEALHDTLTGLGNRTLLLDHLNLVNERKKRNPDHLYALLFLDLDRFKQINDTLGHQAGDQLLIDVAKRLDGGLRATDTVSRLVETDTLARIAGDEFVLLMDEFEKADDILKVADRINALINAPYWVAEQEVTLTASIGLVIADKDYDNPEDVIRDADIAMYRSKRSGGAQVTLFSNEMYQGTITRMHLENDMRKAVEHREFEVFYQPIFLLETDCITGFEALVRWNHPQRGLLLPGEFIKTAEEIGLIIPIGLFVLEEACRQMQFWRSTHIVSDEITMSVNLSAKQIVAPSFLENLTSILEKTGFNPKNLWLEVTESILLENNEMVFERLSSLRAMGILIEIDDFGTGYSSLSYLQHLPIDGFKIDRCFIKDIHDDEHKIVRSLIELGRNLGLIEVAEGVETEAQKAFLKRHNCQFAQGYLMSRPVNASTIEQILMKAQE